MSDMAHYAGLVATGLYPSPVGIADFTTTTTHKTLPRTARRPDPRQGRAGKAGQLRDFPRPAGRAADARDRGESGGAGRGAAAGVQAVPGEGAGERAHHGRDADEARPAHRLRRDRQPYVLLDLRAKNVTGKDAEDALGRAHITVNKNAIPNDPQKPTVTSGIRIGSPAMTTRGFGAAEAEKLANLVADALESSKDEVSLQAGVARGAGDVREVPGLHLSRCAARSAANEDTQVVDTRSNEGTNVIRRRRKCPKCDKRFTTYERVELRMPRLVKKGGSRTDFDRDKLVGSMTLALRKRPVADGGNRRRRRPHRGKAARARRARDPDQPRGRPGDARAREARQDRLHPLRLGLPQLRVARRFPRSSAGSQNQETQEVMSFTAFDRAMMARALELAGKGLFTTTPNPRVGCVITQGETVVGEGWHEKAGGPHAEVLAIGRPARRRRARPSTSTSNPATTKAVRRLARTWSSNAK